MRNLFRRLCIRREINRRLKLIGMEPYNVPDDAASMRHGAYLALVALRDWVNGQENDISVDTDATRG